MSKYKVLGIPETIGELKEMIKDYLDSTSFGFSHQPIQELMESTSDDGRTFVTFNERKIIANKPLTYCPKCGSTDIEQLTKGEDICKACNHSWDIYRPYKNVITKK